jgi:predicted TIM-barrel fold metal-dependent hydrolase
MCGYAFYGVDHLLFATDAPLGPRYGLTAETISSIELMPIAEADKKKIFTQNAVNLLESIHATFLTLPRTGGRGL